MNTLGYISAFILGAVIEATDYQFLVKGVSWTDILAALSAIATAVIVYKTYSKWLDSRKREDAYQTSKDYISCLVSISELIDELMYPLAIAVPQAGSIPIDAEQSKSLLASSNESHHKLMFQARQLGRTKSELSFWGAKLTPEFEKVHDQLLQELRNCSVITTAVLSQINWYYHVDRDKSESMYDEFNKLQQRINTINKLLNSRYNKQYSDFFEHNK